MSFAGDVKDELLAAACQARHCQIAEICGILCMSSSIEVAVNGGYAIGLCSENRAAVSRLSLLLKKCYRIRTEVSVRPGNRSNMYRAVVTDPEDALKVLQGIGFADMNGDLDESFSIKDALILNRECCRRSFLRGAYISSGAMSNPESSYHMEFVCGSAERADEITGILEGFGLLAKNTQRKGNYIVYLKEGDAISDLLGIMSATGSLMDFENLRILKEMRNSVNRKVNCETANINKTVSAAVRQIRDIELIRSNDGLKDLSPALREMAEIRLAHPDTPLNELGKYMDPPVGKSGVNHRLRKLTEIADKYR